MIRFAAHSHRISWVSTGFAEGVGLGGQDLVGRLIFDVLDVAWTPELRARFAPGNLNDTASSSDALVVRISSAQPTPSCFHLRNAPWQDGAPGSIVAQLEPITADFFDAQTEIADGVHLYAALVRDEAGALDVIRDRLDADPNIPFDIGLDIRQPSGVSRRIDGSVERVVWSGRPAIQIALHNPPSMDSAANEGTDAVHPRVAASDSGHHRHTRQTGTASLLTWLESADPRGHSVVVLFDADAFSHLGARTIDAAGDDALDTLETLIRGDSRDGDFAANVGGNRFAMCTTAATGRDAYVFAEHVDTLIAQPFLVADTPQSVAISLGASWGTNAEHAVRLIEQAEAALDDARSQGGHRLCFYEGDDPGGWSDKASFAREMRRGLATGEVFVAYQPIVELASGEVRKVEAIARWTHPERGDVPPPCSSRSPNHSI